MSTTPYHSANHLPSSNVHTRTHEGTKDMGRREYLQHTLTCVYICAACCVSPPVAGENLGEVLSGDLIENTLYTVGMGVEESCQIVCRRAYNNEELAHFAEKIEEEYRVNWLLDGLPAATKYFTAALPSDDTKEPYVQHYEKGFALGFVGHSGMQTA